jgi:hypothetical protein
MFNTRFPLLLPIENPSIRYLSPDLVWQEQTSTRGHSRMVQQHYQSYTCRPLLFLRSQFLTPVIKRALLLYGHLSYARRSSVDLGWSRNDTSLLWRWSWLLGVLKATAHLEL